MIITTITTAIATIILNMIYRTRQSWSGMKTIISRQCQTIMAGGRLRFLQTRITMCQAEILRASMSRRMI